MLYILRTGQGDQLQCLRRVLQKQLLVKAEAVVNIAAVVDIEAVVNQLLR